MECGEGKCLVTTTGSLVASTGISHNMEACNNEEADTRMLAHIQLYMMHWIMVLLPA